MKNSDVIRVNCPGCNTRYKLEPKYAGRSFPCRKEDCEETVHVPSLGNESSTKAPPPPLPNVPRAKSSRYARPHEEEPETPARGGLGLVILLGIGAAVGVVITVLAVGGYFLLKRDKPAEVVANTEKPESTERTAISPVPPKVPGDSGTSTTLPVPSKKLSDSDKLIGRWRISVPADAGDGQAIMEFLGDGTCKLELSLNGKAAEPVTGNWKYADGTLSVTMSTDGAKSEDSTITWKGANELALKSTTGEAIKLLRENGAASPATTPATTGDSGSPVKIVDNPDKLDIQAKILPLNERQKAGRFHVGTKPDSAIFQPAGLPATCKLLVIEWTTKDKDTFAANFRVPSLSGEGCHPGELKGDSTDYPVPALAFDKMNFKEFPIVSVIAGGPGGPVRSGFIQSGGVLKMAWPVPEKCPSVNLEMPGRKPVRIELIAGAKAEPKPEVKAEPKIKPKVEPTVEPKIEPDFKVLPASTLPLPFKSKDGKETLTLIDIKYGTIGKPEDRRDKNNFNAQYQVTPVTVSDKRLTTSDCILLVFNVTKGFMPTIDGGGKCELITPQGKRFPFRSLADKEDYKKGFEMLVQTPGWLSIITTQHPKYENGKPRNIILAFEMPPEKATCRVKGLQEFPLVEFALP